MPAEGSGAAAAISYVIAARDAQFQKVADRVTRRLDRLERRGLQTTRQFRRMDTQLDRTRARFRRLGASMRSLPIAGAVGAGGALGLVALTKRIVTAGVALERLQSRFRAASGSMQAAGEDFAFVRREAQRLGIDFNTAANAYSGLAAAARGSLGVADTREIFLGVAEASRVLGLEADQTRGALQAIEQIMSKGNVQAEELRGQLGERLPGAFQIAARAMGVTTAELNKMLQLGQVTATDFLPKFARQLRKEFGDEVPAAAKQASASFERLGNAIERLAQSIAASGLLDFLSRAAEFTARMVDDLASIGAASPLDTPEGQALQRRHDRERLALGQRGGSLAEHQAMLARHGDERNEFVATHRSGESRPLAARPALAGGGAAAQLPNIDLGRVTDTVPARVSAFSDDHTDTRSIEQRVRHLRREQMITRELGSASARLYQASQRYGEALDANTEKNLQALAFLERETAAADKARAAEEKLIEQRERAQERLGEIIGNFVRQTGDLGEAVRGLFDSISNAIIDSFASALSDKLLSNAAGSFLGSILGGSGTALFGAARGGPAQRGRAILVGEQGPEVFVPGASGRVLPNPTVGAGGRGGVSVTNVFNIESTDGPGVRAALEEAEPRFTSAALGALAVQQSRPGSLLGQQNRR